MNIVLYSDDILLINHWEKALDKKCTLVDDIEDLLSIKDSLIIVNYSACHSGCEDILGKITQNNKVLILHRVPDIETAKFMLSNGAKGYGNALMKEHFIVSAVETIKDGMIWLYPEFTSMLIEDLSVKKSDENTYRLEVLSEREKEVALLLKDGPTYKDIAIKLDITPRTVKAHAQSIYKKLLVKDRIGLALLLK